MNLRGNVSMPGTEVLLQTAVVTAQHWNKSVPCRILFDSGSQRTYMTQKLSDHLKLPVKDQQTVFSSRFGDNSYPEQVCDIVDLHLTTRASDLNFPLRATVTQQICVTPSSSKNVDLSMFASIQLAEYDSSRPVDILVGLDYYYQMILGETFRPTHSPIAVKSIFGWILGGPTSSSGPLNLSIEIQSLLLTSAQRFF